jgi:hypothetical protein
MGKFGFIDRFFGDTPDDEELAANNLSFDEDADDDRDEDDEEEEGGDDDEDEAAEDEDGASAAEDEAALKRLDGAFRALRAKVRASSDLVELRTLRAEHLDSLSGTLSPTLRLRTQDLIEEIDERVTELRARRARRDT